MSHPLEHSTPLHVAPSPWVGTEWIVDAMGCNPAALCDLSLLVDFCDAIVSDLGLHVIGKPLAHAFPSPGGVTVLLMLSESHLACHTYPEYGLATFNLYCCREREGWRWREQLVTRLGASDVVIRQVPRGALAQTRGDE
ncbi:MAG: S-adenosylmethionine decarboxylase family protein [Planctomycetaceae bacterium]